jgi:hypothetical protein
MTIGRVGDVIVRTRADFDARVEEEAFRTMRVMYRTAKAKGWPSWMFLYSPGAPSGVWLRVKDGELDAVAAEGLAAEVAELIIAPQKLVVGTPTGTFLVHDEGIAASRPYFAAVGKDGDLPEELWH